MEICTVMSQLVEGLHAESRDVPCAGALLAEHDAEARGNMYRFLSAVYLGPPTPDLVRRVVDADFLDELSSLFGEEAVAALREFAATAHPTEDLGSLKQEYMDLFAVPTGRYVTPFEDVYRGTTADGKQERGPLLGVRAIAVRRRYRQAGAEMDRDCKELPTHIGVELSFMGFLCESEAAAIRSETRHALPHEEQGNVPQSTEYRKLQMRFLQEHLNDWFPQLSRSIQANAKSHFYRGLAMITEEFLVRDMESLSPRPHPESRSPMQA
jgi:TorA maturation chaperone TorD